MVKELHKAGIEVIMQFYFPQSVSRSYILEVIKYWVKEYHVDGFHVIGGNLPITSIVQDPLLSRTKIFADNFNGQFDIRRKYKNLYIYIYYLYL